MVSHVPHSNSRRSAPGATWQLSAHSLPLQLAEADSAAEDTGLGTPNVAWHGRSDFFLLREFL